MKHKLANLVWGALLLCACDGAPRLAVYFEGDVVSTSYTPGTFWEDQVYVIVVRSSHGEKAFQFKKNIASSAKALFPEGSRVKVDLNNFWVTSLGDIPRIQNLVAIKRIAPTQKAR